MKRYWKVSIVLLLLLSLLTGCGAASKDMMSEPEAAAPAATESAMDEALYDELSSSEGTAATMPANQKLIRTVYMDAQTQSMDTVMGWIENRVAALGGYFEQKSVRRSGSRDDGSYYRYADMMIRIPAQALDGFLAQVGENAVIISSSEETENVTLTYVSTQSRVQALETEQKRLLELLENAETMEDLLVIEERLTDVRWELENYASQLRLLDNQVNYSTIHLSIHEVDKPKAVTERTVWQKIGDGFTENAAQMWDGLVNFFIWLLVMIPYLIPLALVAGVFLLAFKLGKKRKPEKKRTKEKPKEDTEH